jgi:hypothetical protein
MRSYLEELRSARLTEAMDTWRNSLPEGLMTASMRHFRRERRAAEGKMHDIPLGILAALGCIHLECGQESIRLNYPLSTLSDPPPMQWMPLLLSTTVYYRQVMSADVSSLLSTLGECGRWRRFILDGHADLLALALLAYASENRYLFVGMREQQAHRSLDSAAMDKVLYILNEWLEPERPWCALPTLDVLLHCFFGDAWVLMGFTAETDVCDVVRAGQTMLVPRLYAANNPVAEVLLPNLSLMP